MIQRRQYKKSKFILNIFIALLNRLIRWNENGFFKHEKTVGLESSQDNLLANLTIVNVIYTIKK